MTPSLVSLVGNPRPNSRTRAVAESLTVELCRVLDCGQWEMIDLSEFGSRVLDPADGDVAAALATVMTADILVVASPTYKATYSALLKGFLEHLDTGSLSPCIAIPILLGGAPSHQLAVDVHFTPLLLELGARVPARGLFVRESQLSTFAASAAAWADQHQDSLIVRPAAR